MTRLLVGTPATISATWFVDGDIADPGVVTIDITRADGTVLVDDGATQGTGAAPRTFTLDQTNHTNLLDNLSVIWASASLGNIPAEVMIVGDLLFSESDARNHDKGQLSDVVYTDADIIAARNRIWEQFEQIIGIALGSQYRRVILDGDGRRELILPDLPVTAKRSIEERLMGAPISQEASWTPFPQPDFDDVILESWGNLIRETLGAFTWGRQNFRVAYEHGGQPIPHELREAALDVAVASVVPSDIDPRAQSFSDELGTIRFVTPGLTRGAYTDLPEVNEVLGRYHDKYLVPGIG